MPGIGDPGQGVAYSPVGFLLHADDASSLAIEHTGGLGIEDKGDG